jgi:hypothetical protein
MKNSFSVGRISTTLEIAFKGTEVEFLKFYKQSLDHLTNPEQNAQPVANFPRVTGYVVKPGGYIFLQSKNQSKRFLKSFLKEIISIHPQYLKDIVLVGRKWLKLDIDWIPKSDQNFNYIVFEGKILKVIPTKNNYKSRLSDEFISPQSWIWLVEIVQLKPTPSPS